MRNKTSAAKESLLSTEKPSKAIVQLAIPATLALYPAFGLCYMMTITFQTIGGSKMGLFLSLILQGLFYVPFILLLPRLLGVTGIYFSQPAADVLTVLICLFLIRPMKRMASKNMLKEKK